MRFYIEHSHDFFVGTPPAPEFVSHHDLISETIGEFNCGLTTQILWENIWIFNCSETKLLGNSTFLLSIPSCSLCRYLPWWLKLAFTKGACASLLSMVAELWMKQFFVRTVAWATGAVKLRAWIACRNWKAPPLMGGLKASKLGQIRCNEHGVIFCRV